MRTHVPSGGVALFRLVRYWSRRWAAADRPFDGLAPHVLHVQVLEAVDAARARGHVSVAEVAAELGIDRSGASRMVSASVEAGYLDKTTSADDARRTELALGREGRKLLAAARSFQERTFDELVATWSPADRRRFAGYLERLAHERSAREGA